MSKMMSARILDDMEAMQQSEIINILMPERTRQIALACSILRQTQLAEDAYQDMLTKVLENEDAFEGPRHLRDWSWKVLRNRCYELIRKQKYQPSLLEQSVLELVDGELENRDLQDMTQRADALRDCLNSLTDKTRQIIQMKFFDGLRPKQVAQKLDRNPDAIYKTLQRSYISLAECIDARLESGGAS